jgi:ferritin-like protein
VSTTTSDTDLTISSLDSFYCANAVVSLWADAVGNRLEGPAIFLLTDELAEVSEHARAAAEQLADRIGDLGGAITADPRQLLDTRPGDSDFELPDCGDVRSITEAGLRELSVIIAAYEEFLVRVRDTDPVSHQLVTRLLGDETHRRADIQAALQRP